jgi:hypothetical protein
MDLNNKHSFDEATFRDDTSDSHKKKADELGLVPILKFGSAGTSE